MFSCSPFLFPVFPQIAYLLVGWAIMALMLCLVFLAITFTTVLPLLDIYGDWFWGPWVFSAAVPLAISLVFYFLQVLLVRVIFSVRCVLNGSVRDIFFLWLQLCLIPPPPSPLPSPRLPSPSAARRAVCHPAAAPVPQRRLFCLLHQHFRRPVQLSGAVSSEPRLWFAVDFAPRQQHDVARLRVRCGRVTLVEAGAHVVLP